jgi:raffinose/stachyose/melibiose transport system substrate-binding protein
MKTSNSPTRMASLLAAVSIIAAACAGSTSPNTASTSAAPPSESSAPATSAPATSPSASAPDLSGVTLTLWRENYDVKGIDDVNAAFEARTHAKIQVTKVPPPGDNILPKWATGEHPDVLYLEGFASTMAKLNAAQTLQPMDDFAFVQNIQPSLKDFGILDGVRYWAPLTAPSVNGLLYNKDVVAKVGATLPTNEQELLTFCGKAKAGGVAPIALGEKSTFMAWAMLDAMAGDYLLANPTLRDSLMANSASFTNPEYVKRIQSILDLKKAGCFEDNAQAVDFNGAMQLFMTDKAAIFNCGNFCVPDLIGAFGAEAVNKKVGFLPISYAKPVVWVYGGDEWGIYLPKSGDPAKEAAAKAYVDFALGEGYPIYLKAQLENTRYPSVYPVPDPKAIAVPITEADAAAKTYPPVPALEPLLKCGYGVPGDLFTALSEMYVGQKTAEQVAQGMDATLKQSCKDLGVPGF